MGSKRRSVNDIKWVCPKGCATVEYQPKAVMEVRHLCVKKHLGPPVSMTPAH